MQLPESFHRRRYLFDHHFAPEKDERDLDLSNCFTTFTPGIYKLRLTASNRLRARLAFYELSSLYAF